MLTPRDIVTFNDALPTPGKSAWVDDAAPVEPVDIAAPDPSWADRFTRLAADIRALLGAGALAVEHAGSTAVPGLAAKAVIDIDLTVADPAEERADVPALTALGYRLVVREPWWYEHRCRAMRIRGHSFTSSPPAALKLDGTSSSVTGWPRIAPTES